MTASTRPRFAPTREMYIAGFVLLAIIWHLVFRCLLHFPALSYNLPLFAALLAAAPLLWVLVQKIMKLEFGADLLPAISIIPALILVQYLVAAIVVLTLSGGEAMEEFAT